ncbi:MAG: hypothetical protein M0C28_32570 [Candidatus Moduliflexus flocculans]|nr:hypothetical protein [Candidatus Moduliflexus flocculans]
MPNGERHPPHWLRCPFVPGEEVVGPPPNISLPDPAGVRTPPVRPLAGRRRCRRTRISTGLTRWRCA